MVYIFSCGKYIFRTVRQLTCKGTTKNAHLQENHAKSLLLSKICLQMGCIMRTYFRGEEVPRMALRVLRPKSPHSKEVAQYIEWRDPCGHAAVWL